MRFIPSNTIYITQPLFNACFYAIRSFFVFYISWRLAATEFEAIGTFSMFMASCYGTTLLGGYLADKSLGVKNGVLWGGLLSVSGLLCLFYPSRDMCFMGLALFSMGSGLFKPNLTAAIGLIFENPQDPMKSNAFSTIYAIGNLSTFVLVPLCGFVGEGYGWEYALGVPLSFLIGGTIMAYQTMSFHPSHKRLPPSFSTKRSTLIVGLFIFGIFGLFHYRTYFNWVMAAGVLVSIVYIGKVFLACNTGERKAIWSIIGFIFLFTICVALAEQSGTSFNFFIQKAVNREAMGLTIPSSALLSLNSLFVFICGITLLPLFARYVEKEKPVKEITKVGYSFLFTATGFFVLAFASYQNRKGLIPLSWVILVIFLETLGELWIAPITLSKISQSAPPRFHSTFMSLWTMTIAYGHYLAGIIAQFSVKPGSAPTGDASHYVAFFASLGAIALLISAFVFVGQRVAPSLLEKLGKAPRPGA